MALQFKLSSAGSPIFNIPRTSRCWWHRNEISNNYRGFYGVLGNPNDILSMTRRFGLKKVNDVIGTHPRMWEKLRVFNEVWLEVQGRFIQDHQDIGRATREAFKLVWIKRPQLSVWRSPRRGWSKTYVLALPDPDKSFISTMMHLVKVWDVSLCKKKNVVPCSLSQLRKRELNYLTCI